MPEGEDRNEWIAVNTVDFFNQINMLYGTITEFCTEDRCPIMSAGPKYEYHWADGQTVKKPIKCSAPKYIDYLMTWVQDQLDDEALFPSKIGKCLFEQSQEKRSEVKRRETKRSNAKRREVKRRETKRSDAKRREEQRNKEK